MKIIKQHIVQDKSQNIRIYDYCIDIFKDFIPSRKGIKKAIEKGEILLNGQKVETGRYVKTNDKIELIETEKNIPKIYNLRLDVVYEDDYLAVIVKPAGINVSGNMYRTIVNSLPYNLKKSSQKDAFKFPKPVHRLDNQTSGLLIIAKTSNAMIKLSSMFEKKEIIKKYIAVVIGKINKNGIIDFEIENKKSITYYKRLEVVKSIKNKYLSLIELEPKTGRTHQLRIHLSKIGFPILGDKLYGKENMILKHKGLFLFAGELEFSHPVDKNKINIKLEIPHKFSYLLKKEEEMYYKKFPHN